MQAATTQTVLQGTRGCALSSAEITAQAHTASPDRPGFRADIQGLRAIAVVSVVLYHAFHGRWVTGGFVGVDVFFVISGYLITGILLREAAEGRFSIAGFYRRRVRRLFPALVPVLLASLVAGYFLLTDRDYRELALTAAATATFTANVVFYRLTGYFSGAGDDKPLLHMWSLSVEEQFYLLYPLFLWVICRRFRPALPALLAAVGLVSVGLSVWLSDSHPVAAFYLAPTRAYELVAGCLTALAAGQAARLPRLWREALSLAGLAMIAGSAFAFSGLMAFPGVLALVPCLGTALVIFCGVDGRPLGSRMISTALFRFFGDISYSLYLWHWPLLCFARQWALGDVSPAVTALLLVASVVMAALSWTFLERPVLKAHVRWPPFRAGIAAMAALVAVSSAIWFAKGLPQRFGPESLAMFAARDDVNAAGRRCLYSGGAPIPYDDSCVFGAAGAAPSVAVWADSQGAELAAALGERLAARGAAVRQVTASGCPPVLGYRDHLHPDCARHNAETLARLQADKRIGQVVLAANFGGYAGVISPQQIDRGFSEAVWALRRAGKRVTLVEPIPVFRYDPPKALGVSVQRGGDPTTWGVARAEHEARNAPFLAMIDGLARTTGADAVRTADIFCDARLCTAYSAQEGVLYFDANHPGLAGARRIAAALAPP